MSDAPRYPKPEPLPHIPDLGHAIVEASAGTGKTHTLVHLVVDLILAQGVGLCEILVVTLTNEAAAELKRRVREAIGTLLALRETTTRLSAEQCWVVNAPGHDRLRQALLDFDLARIGTVQAWANELVNENPFLVGSLFEREPVDERALFSRAFREALLDENVLDPARQPYLSAWLAVKKSTLNELEEVLFRAASVRGRLVPRFDPDSILRAVRVVSDRMPLEATLSDVVPRNVFEKVQRNLGRLRIALETNDVALLLAELEGVDLLYLGEKLETLLGPAGVLEAEAVSLAAAMVSLFLPAVVDRLKRIKRESGLYESGDPIRDLLETLEGPRGSELIRILQSQYRAVLIDEFQETDETQWLLFKKVFFDTAGHHRLRVVSDPKGAVGSLRAGDLEVYQRAKKELVTRSTVVPLVESFRATSDLVEGLNLVFDQSDEQPFFSGPARYDKPLRPGRRAATLLGVDGSARPPVILLRAEGDHSKRLLASGIADEVRTIVSDPERHLVFGERGNEKRVRLEDILVLTANHTDADEIAKALESRGIGYAFYKREGLFQSREARDVRDLLAAIESPGDRSKRMRAFLTPFFGLSLRELESASELEKRHPLIRRLTEWGELAERSSSEALFHRILEESGMKRRALFSPENERALTNIGHIFESLVEDRRTSRATLRELTTRLEAYIDGRGQPPGSESNLMRLGSEDAVRISTIRVAKGLEAVVVFLYPFSTTAPETVHLYHDPEDGERCGFVGDRRRAPADVRAAIEREELEKSQRLLYVALTRAKARIYLPLVPDVLAKRSVYAQLHDRLQDLLGVFPIQPISNGSSPPESGHLDLSSWRPPLSLLEAPEAPLVFDGTARPHRSLGSIASSVGVPGCLRDVLDAVPLESFGNAGETVGLDEWRKLEDVERVVHRALRSCGVDRRARPEVERLAYAAFTTPVPLFQSRLESGLWTVRDGRRKVDYIQARKGHAGQTATGSIDFLFQHEGLVYLCGFGHDALPDPNGESQCLAVLEMIRVSNEEDYLSHFGGVLFCSLPDMPGSGVRFERPTWQRVLQWNEELWKEKLS